VTRVCVFDVDETLARDDLIVPLVRALLRRRPGRVAALAPALPRVGLRLRAGDHDAAKLALLGPLLRGLGVPEVDRIGERIARAATLNADVLAALERHRAAGEPVWLASAQVEPIVRPLALRVRADGYVATALSARDGVLDGGFAGANLRGTAKLAALDAALPDGWRASCIAYSDGDADTPLLTAVSHPVRVAAGRLLATTPENRHA
jgi:HAD superfamily hydrolase (TIGR01490 family)